MGAPPLSPSSREGWASSPHPALRPLPGTTWGKGGPSRHTLENPHRPTPRFPHNQITHRDPSLTPLPAWLLARGGEEEVFLDSKKKTTEKEITCYEPVPQERDPPWFGQGPPRNPLSGAFTLLGVPSFKKKSFFDEPGKGGVV